METRQRNQEIASESNRQEERKSARGNARPRLPKGFVGPHAHRERQGVGAEFEFIAAVENHCPRHRRGVPELLLRGRANDVESADVDDRIAGDAPAVADAGT